MIWVEFGNTTELPMFYHGTTMVIPWYYLDVVGGTKK